MAIPGTAITIGTISCFEADDSYRLEMGEQLTGYRKFWVEWSSRIDLAKELRGYITSRGEGKTTFIRTAPQTFPGFDELYCTRVTVVGFGTPSQDSDGDPSYTYAQLDAVYEPLSGEPGSNTEEETVIATLDVDWQTEFLTYPSLKVKWAGTSASSPVAGNIINDEINVGKLVVKVPQRFTQHDLPSIPVDKIYSLVGKVNETEWHGADAEKLLYVGATTKKRWDSEGNVRYDLTHQFLYRPEAEWNKFYNIDAQQWEWIMIADDSATSVHRPFTRAEFSGLVFVEDLSSTA